MAEPAFNPESLRQLDRDRLAGYRANLDFYNGSQWTEASRGRQLVFNYARVSIDKLTSYLMQGLNFACDPSGESGRARAAARRAEQLLYHIYQENSLQELDYETEVDAAILGDGCYKVTWDVREKRVRITSPDVHGVFAWWLGDDLSRVWRLASRYQLTQEEIAMLYRRRIPKKTAVVTELWTAAAFQLYLDREVIASRPNPYGFIPFVLFPNLRQPKHFWGTSDIPPLKPAQRELNRALTQL